MSAVTDGNIVGQVIKSVIEEKQVKCDSPGTGNSVGHVMQPAFIGNMVEMSHVPYGKVTGNVTLAPIHQSFAYLSTGNYTFGPVHIAQLKQ